MVTPLTTPPNINALSLQHITTQSIMDILTTAAQLVPPTTIELAFVTSLSSCLILLNTIHGNNPVNISRHPLQQLKLSTSHFCPQATYVNSFTGTNTFLAYQYTNQNTRKLNQQGNYPTTKVTDGDNYQLVRPPRASTRRQPQRNSLNLDKFLFKRLND